jgi:hypothetical protein
LANNATSSLSGPSTMTLISGSVPDLRNKTRPLPANTSLTSSTIERTAVSANGSLSPEKRTLTKS